MKAIQQNGYCIPGAKVANDSTHVFLSSPVPAIKSE
jgi:hypothetical protein